eukprot:1528821-Alexandrium_andersonii.AAC.1
MRFAPGFLLRRARALGGDVGLPVDSGSFGHVCPPWLMDDVPVRNAPSRGSVCVMSAEPNRQLK